METANTPALLLLNLPPSALAGINLLSFTVAPRFHGVKDLPPGCHFAFASTTSAFSERHGLWFRIPSKSESSGTPLCVCKWDASTETLVAETNEAERLRWRANLGSIWKEGLMPYRQTTSTTAAGDYGEDHDEEEVKDWPSLTFGISDVLLTRITGGDPNHWRLTSASSAKRDLEDIPGLSATDLEQLQADKELCMLPINLKQTWRQGATGRERTEAAQDRSWALENIKSQHCTNADINEIIGELQFCFLMTLTINNFSCLEQWKRILMLIFTCNSAVGTYSDFFISAIATLRLQLQHCKDAEGGLIDLADEGGSLLKSLLARFRRGLEGMTGTNIADVVDELDDLEEYLRTEQGWTLGGDFARSGVLELADGEQVLMESTAFDADDETGEFAPQMVDLTPEQARLLGITPEQNHDLGAVLGKTSVRDKVASVVQDSESDDDVAGGASDENEQDLDEMDSRY